MLQSAAKCCQVLLNWMILFLVLPKITLVSDKLAVTNYSQGLPGVAKCSSVAKLLFGPPELLKILYCLWFCSIECFGFSM